MTDDLLPRRLVTLGEGDDGVDIISRGTHERHVIDKARFDAAMEQKRAGVA